MKKSITVFTPTFNRIHCLNKCYESLKRQTSKDFLWLIIDDGSTDGTQSVVNEWINNGEIEISYYFKENQGMHSAHNAAYSLINTELNVCIDSDDFMTDDAIENILKCWQENKDNKYSGIVALNIDTYGRVIGTKLPENIKAGKLYDQFYYKMKMKGDKKLIYRTDVMKEYPEYAIFEDEKYVPLAYKYLLAEQDYDLIIMNKPVCVVEYLSDGSSMNMIHQYRKNPKGFAFFRKAAIKHTKSLTRRFVEAVHYISSSIMMKNKKFLEESPRKLLTILAMPLGIFWYIYIINTNRNTLKID